MMKTRGMTTTNIVTRMAVILMLAVGFMSTAAMAQENERGGSRPIGHYIGVETATGTLEQISGNHYGNTLVLNHFNEGETRCLTVSVDYATTQFVPDSFIVIGGSWSLVVFRDGVYAGTVYGKVMGGNVLISTNNNGDPIQLMEANLLSTGGLGLFENKDFRERSGSFSATTDMRSSSAKGNIEIIIGS